MRATHEQLRSIAEEAAFIAAVLSDSTLSSKARDLELKDSLSELLPQLQGAGLMEPYQRAAGIFGI